MRGSLDDLIRFLLEEIALCGEQGARPVDVLDYIAAHYKEHSEARDRRANVIDRLFQEQVWKWLTRHPEIHVGRKNQGNELSLSEVEAWNTSDTQRHDRKATLKTAEQISRGEAENVPSAAPQSFEDHDARSPLQPQATSASQGAGSDASSQPLLAPNPQGKSSKNGSLRVYTSQSRMWSATAGHAPDFNRIPRLDFILLSIIAARRGKGILQPDLVRVSGQDKRSVPKRTERLHDSDYIEKKAVSVKGNRTSICVLKRFTIGGAVSKQKARVHGDSDGQDIADRRLVLKENLKNSVVEIEVLLQAILDIVRPVQIVTWDNLKRRLGVWGHAWQSRLTATAVRKLEMVGCAKRVRATGNYRRPGQAYYRCVKYLRDLEQDEWQRCVESQGGALNSLKVGDGDDIDAEGEDDEDYLPGGIHYDAPGDEVQKLELQEVGRIPPRWVAGQTITNFLHDLIHSTGTKGISTMEVKSLAFGEFFSRPLEHQLSRLVDLWQLSQPPHLRHLTIIRDTALTKRIAHYTHYSFDNFTTLVDSGKASWEAVEVVTDSKKKDKTSTAAVDQDSDMIEYGFSKVQASRFQGRHNDATLLECVLASGAEAVYNTPFDHIARQLAEGTFGKGIAIPLEMMIATSDFDQGTRRTIGQGASATPRPKGSPRPKKEPAKPKPATPKSATSIPSATEPAASYPTVPKPALPEPVMAKPTAAEPAVSELTVSKPTVVKVTASYPRRPPKARGRPRKYPAEGTPVDVESLTPHELKKLEKSQERAAHYVRRKKIAEEVAKRVEAGEDPVAANEAVLAELGPPKKEEKASALETHSTAPNPTPSTQRPAGKRKRKASVQTTEPLEGNEILVNSTDKTAEPPTTLSEATTHVDNGKTAIAADSPDLLSRAISRQLDAAGEAVTLKDHGTQPIGISPHPPKKRKKSLKAGENTTRMNATPRTEIKDLKTAVYQALAQDVVRIDRGIGLGPHSTRRTGRGRPRKARLVIIKSTRLIELHLSQKEPEPSVEAATVTISIPSTSHVLEPFLTPTVTEKLLYTPQTVQQPHDQPSVRKVNHVSPYGLMFDEATPTPVPEYVSPYAPKPGEKRKRTPSSALETGFSGPRCGFFKMSPLASASNTGRRSVVPPAQRLKSLVTQHTTISGGQLALEHVIEKVMDSAQQDTTQKKSVITQSAKQDTAPYRPIVGPMEDAMQITSASEEHSAFELPSTDPAHGRRSDSQGTVIDPDSVEDTWEPGQTAPVSGTSVRMDPATIDSSTESLGDPYSGGRTLGEPQPDDLTDTQVAQGTATDSDIEERDRNPGETQLIGEQKRGVGLSVVNDSLGIIGDPKAPGPHADEAQSEEQVAVNGDSTNLKGTATDYGLVENNSNSDEPGLMIAKQNHESEPTGVDICSDAPTGDSDFSGLLSKEKQLDDLRAQQSGLHVHSQSSPETLEDGSSVRQNMSLGGVSLLESTDDKQVEAHSQIASNDGLPRILSVHDADEDSSVKGSSKKKSSKVITRLTPNSGSIGVLRQKIILEIVEACGGVFPGDKELWYPFTTAWLQRMPPGTGRPDTRTIKTAKKALIASERLRQLRFTFLNKHGVMVEKGMITTTDVHSNSPIVKDLQRKMIEQDPVFYVPQEAVVADDLRKVQASAIVFGTNKTTAQLEVDEETQVELQYVPAYVRRAAINKEAAAARKRAATEKRRPDIEEKRRIREEERIRALEEKRRAREEELQKLLGVPDFAINGYRSAEVIMESEKEGTSEFMAIEGASPPPVRRPGRPPGPQKEGIKPKVHRLARLWRPSPSKPLRTLLPQPSSTLPAQSAETGSLSDGYRLTLESAMEQFAVDSSCRTTLRPRQRVDYAAIDRGKTPPPEEPQSGMWTPADSNMIQKLRFTKPLGLDSIFDRAPSPDFEVEGLLTPEDGAKPTFSFNMQLGLPRFDPSYRFQRVSTFMDPDHCFHAATGTYSVTFSVLRNVRLGLDINTNSQAYNEPALPDVSADTSSQSFKHKVSHQFEPLSGSKSLFHCEIDDMLLTELNTPNLDAPVSKNRFINHVMPHPHFIAERPIKISSKTPRLAKALSAWPNKASRSASEAIPPPTRSKLIVLKVATHHLASLSDRPPAPKLFRDTKTCHDVIGRPLRRARVPGSGRSSRYMSLAMEKRLMTAVVVIRTLTGGLEANLDWNIVAPIFQSSFTTTYMHNRWASLRIKYQVEIKRMQADFQDLFATAYEDNLVPPLDFDNIEGYDWAWLVDWTQKHLESSSSNTISDLPMDRAQLHDRYDLRQSKEADLCEYFFSLDPTHTFVRRRARLHREPMVAPLTPKSRKIQGEDHELLEVAKSWVRANVITLHSVYNPTLAHQKLSSLPESSISTALQFLLSDRVIAQVEKGRLVPGRNYSLSEFFFTRLKKSLEVPQLQRATLYKLELDRSIAEHGKAEICYYADDGDMLALTNLVAHRRVKLVPRDPPMEKFGLVDGGYKTRFMDKSRLTFAVDIVPTATYVPGLPSLPPHPVPPTTNPNDPRAKLPAWIDIHGNFVREMWELALAAVLSLVTLRPGMGAQEVAGSVAPCLGKWEVESLLAWLVQAGVAEWTEGGSVLVGEGWWGVFGGEGGWKGKGKERGVSVGGSGRR